MQTAISMSVPGHAISLGSGAGVDKHEHSCDAFGEYDVFLHAPGREKARERATGHRVLGELLEAFEAHRRFAEGQTKYDAGQLCTNQKVRAREVQE